MTNNKINFVFWGTDKFSVVILEELKASGLIPDLIITAPDRPAGRGQKMHQSDVKIWALENKICILQPDKLDSDFESELINFAKNNQEIGEWDVFVLASYGKIITQSVLDIPQKGTLNVHPSLLPQYRGASPIETAILDDNKDTGVTIMLMDSKMDHGPIIDQEFVSFDNWPKRELVESKLARVGAKMLVRILPEWILGKIDEQEQEHEMATFTKKISKEDGLIDFTDIKKLINHSKDEAKEDLEPEKQRGIFLKIIAMNPWPGAYFFINHTKEDVRVKIVDAKWENERLEILKVIPAGRKEISWQAFLNGFIH